MVLCGASVYEKKYYLNPAFKQLPDQIKDELKLLCVLFTEEIGGEILLQFDKNSSLQIQVSSEEGDLLYDEIGSGLKIKQIQNEKQELFEQLDQCYRTFIVK